MAEIEKSSSAMKKIAIGFSVFFGILILLALVIPFVVDVDQYRPRIVSEVNKRINGELELGKLKLSLWGRVHVNVGGVKLMDLNKKELLSVQDALFHVSFWSFLTGSPQITFKMDQPKVNVLKNKKGKINLLSLVKKDESQKVTSRESIPKSAPKSKKTESKETKKTAPKVATSTHVEDEKTEIPALMAAARLGIELTRAQLQYNDLQTGLSNNINDLNILLKDLSLSRTSHFEVWADVDTKLKGTMSVKGPFRIEGTLTPELSESELSGLKGKLKIDLDSMAILVPGTFEKTEGIATNFSTEFDARNEEVNLKNATIQFHKISLNAKGKLTGMDREPVADFQLNTNQFELQPLTELLPALKDFKVSGNVKLDASANGALKKLNYAADLSLEKIQASAPMLKVKPTINGKIEVRTNQIRKILLTMNAPGNDLKITGNLKSFTTPKLTLSVNSNSINLDKLIDMPKSASYWPEGFSLLPIAHAKAKETDYDKLVAPLRENATLKSFQMLLNINLKSIQSQGVRISNFNSQLTIAQLKAVIKKLSLRLFGGVISTQASLDLKGKAPTYRFNSKISDLDMEKAVKSQMKLFENTVIGKLSMQVAGNGRSFNPEPAKRNFNLKGKLKIIDAEFTSIDVGKMTTEAFNNGLEKVSGKVPKLGGKLGKYKLKGLPDRSTRYESVTSDFSLSKGSFSSPNFFAKALARKGVDIRGKTEFNILNDKLNARWEILDTHNLTKGRDISPSIAGTEIKHILSSENGPVTIPVTVGCTLTKPCYSYSEVPGHFAKVATNNISKAATRRAKSEAKKALQKAVKKAPKPVENILKKGFKKFF